MSTFWGQEEPRTYSLTPIRDMRWDTDPDDSARKLARKLNYSQKVNAALETQLLDARRENAELAVALVLARKPRPTWRERCRKAVRRALRSRRGRVALWAGYGAAYCFGLLYLGAAVARFAVVVGWVK